MPDWNTDVRPVLEGAAAAIEKNHTPGEMFDTSGQRINEALGRDPDDQRTGDILMELRRSGYVEGEWAMQSSLPLICRLTKKGYQTVAGWPAKPGDDVLPRLLEVLDVRIREAATPEERTRLEKFRDSAASVGKDVLTDVLSKMATGQLS